MHEHYLQPLFEPESIALIGASSRTQSFGGRVFEALIGGGFTGKLYMVNPGYRTVGEHKCYPTAQALPESVDLAVIVSPVHTVERIIEDCAARGIKHAMVMTGGFANNHNWGTTPSELADKARELGVRLLGPSCLGLVNTWANLMLTPASQPVSRGHVGLISHSAAMCTSVVDWAHSNNVGFSTIITPGKESDLSISEVLDYLLHDFHTHAILIYLDKIPSAREFLNALSTAARAKPVVVMKSPEAGRQYCDALSRTGELLNYDHVNDSALARAGAVRVDSFGELFSAAQILSSDTKLRGSRLGVISNGKGPASLIADRLANKNHALQQFSAETTLKLDSLLGTEWSRRNPIVLRGRNMAPEVHAEVAELLAQSKDVDALMVVHAPDGWIDSTAVAESTIQAKRPNNMPLFSCFMGESLTASARELLREKKIPTFRTPESAANGYSYLCAHLQNQRLLLQVPDASGWREQTAVDEGRALVKSVLAEGRRVMRLPEAHTLLQHFNLPANS
ncbi:MAG: acetate--CoA ligase family protein, partial [Granulosicoccaceae bacterium]